MTKVSTVVPGASDVPVPANGTRSPPGVDHPLGEENRIGADQRAVLVGVAAAGAGAAGADAAEHRTGVAADDAVLLARAEALGHVGHRVTPAA